MAHWQTLRGGSATANVDYIPTGITKHRMDREGLEQIFVFWPSVNRGKGSNIYSERSSKARLAEGWENASYAQRAGMYAGRWGIVLVGVVPHPTTARLKKMKSRSKRPPGFGPNAPFPLARGPNEDALIAPKSRGISNPCS